MVTIAPSIPAYTIIHGVNNITALVTIDEQDAIDAPYRRLVGQFRFHGDPNALAINVGDSLTHCTTDFVVLKRDRRVHNCYLWLEAVHVSAVAVAPVGVNVVVDVRSPSRTYGDSATTTESNFSTSVAMVRELVDKPEIEQESVRTKTTFANFYCDRATAVQLQEKWSLLDQSTSERWEITAINDLEKPDRLPTLVCRQVGYVD